MWLAHLYEQYEISKPINCVNRSKVCVKNHAIDIRFSITEGKN